MPALKCQEQVHPAVDTTEEKNLTAKIPEELVKAIFFKTYIQSLEVQAERAK